VLGRVVVKECWDDGAKHRPFIPQGERQASTTSLSVKKVMAPRLNERGIKNLRGWNDEELLLVELAPTRTRHGIDERRGFSP